MRIDSGVGRELAVSGVSVIVDSYRQSDALVLQSVSSHCCDEREIRILCPSLPSCSFIENDTVGSIDNIGEVCMVHGCDRAQIGSATATASRILWS
jgi:hypothetical protein